MTLGKFMTLAVMNLSRLILEVEVAPGYALLCEDPEPKHNKVDNASERVKQLRDELHRYKIGYIINAHMFFHLDIEEYIGARFSSN